MAVLGALGDLVLALSADTAKFQSDLGRADRVAKKFGREVGRALGNVAGMLVALGGSAGLTALVKNQIDAADAAGKLGQKIGMSTEALSSYMVAARLADVSNEQLQTGLQQLSKNQAEFVAGTGEAKDAFAALGITTQQIKDLNGDTAAIFELVVGKLASFEDGANKTALAMKIFGRSGAELIPLINGLEKTRTEAEMLGAIIDKDTAAAAERFNDNLTRVGITVQAIGLNIAKAVLPTLEKMSERLIGAAKDAQTMGDAGRIADTGLKLLASAGTIIAAVFKIVGERLGAIFASLVAAGKGDMAGALRIQLDSFGDTVQTVKDAVNSLNDTWGAGGAPARRSFQADIRAIDNAITKGAAPALRNLAEEAKAMAKAMKDAEAALRLEEMAINDITEASEALKNIAIENEKTRQEQIKQTTDAQVESAEIATQIAEDTIYTYDKLGNAIEVTREQFEEMEKQEKKNSEWAREMGLAFNSAFEDAIVSGKSFSDVLKAIEQDIARIILRKSVTEPAGKAITKAIEGIDFKKIFGSGGGGAEATGAEVFGGFDASAIANMQFAEGTDFVPRTGLAMVHKGEKIIPADENRRGGDTYIIDARGAGPSEISRLESIIMRVNGSIEHRAIDAVRDRQQSRGDARV